MLIDSHCHLHMMPEPKLTETLAQLQVLGMRVVTVGTHPKDFDAAIALARVYPHMVSVALGIYPTEVNDSDMAQTVAELKNRISETEQSGVRIVAVGEIGLEAHFVDVSDTDAIKTQEALFQVQLVLAQELKKPVIIHSRNATGRALELLQGFPHAFVMHYFQGTMDEAERTIRMGGRISFPATIATTHRYDTLIKHLPSDRLLCETDAPYVRDNSPLDVRLAYEKIAKLKNIPMEELAPQIRKNVDQVFGV
jgi:TatD DNase family protein